YATSFAEGATEYHLQGRQKAIARMEVILGDPGRLEALAKVFISQYEKRIEENATVAGKVLFVCACREIAYKLFKEMIRLRPEWNEKSIADHLSQKERKEIKPIERIKMVMTRNKNDEESLWNLL